ncbi:MAG: hypothetical protein ACLPKE_33435, partial [Streptosporangiaceae bacterium]
ETLSGGNQQKVILAREVGRDVRLLLASQPTRGLDVGSIEFVHRRIIEERDRGVAVVLVSSELDEIYALSDRIAVMYEGSFTGFRKPDVPVGELGLLMAGIGGIDTPEAGEPEVAGRAGPEASEPGAPAPEAPATGGPEPGPASPGAAQPAEPGPAPPGAAQPAEPGPAPPGAARPAEPDSPGDDPAAGKPT